MLHDALATTLYNKSVPRERAGREAACPTAGFNFSSAAAQPAAFNFGAPQQPAPASNPFGATSTPAPAFGAPAPAFGATAPTFGAPAAAPPAFGAVQSPPQQQQQSAFSIGAGGQNRASGTRRIATARRTRK